MRHQDALGALGAVLSTLEAAGVAALAVKGIVLAYELHADVAERPMSDVDLRILPRDLWRTYRAMKRRGFPCYWTSRQLGALVFRVGRTLVEFEASIGPPGLCAISVARMLSRSTERVVSADLRIRQPDLHDHAILMVVNAFKDKMVKCPEWSLDDLVRIGARIEPEMFLRRVEEARLRAVTWIVADWMARERGSAPWGMLRERLGTSPPRPEYVRAMIRMIDEAEENHSLRVRVLARLGSDSRMGQLGALAATCAGTVFSSIAQRLERVRVADTLDVTPP